jgi:hypothetical protein
MLCMQAQVCQGSVACVWCVWYLGVTLFVECVMGYLILRAQCSALHGALGVLAYVAVACNNSQAQVSGFKPGCLSPSGPANSMLSASFSSHCNCPPQSPTGIFDDTGPRPEVTSSGVAGIWAPGPVTAATQQKEGTIAYGCCNGNSLIRV